MRLEICALVLLTTLGMTTCRVSPTCKDYAEIVESSERREALQEWSDKYIAGLQTTDEEFSVGDLVGPGTYAIDLESRKIPAPPGLLGAEVRVISRRIPRTPALIDSTEQHDEMDEQTNFGVFVGHGSWRGIVVSHSGDRRAVHSLSSIVAGDVISARDRSTAICRARM